MFPRSIYEALCWESCDTHTLSPYQKESIHSLTQRVLPTIPPGCPFNRLKNKLQKSTPCSEEPYSLVNIKSAYAFSTQLFSFHVCDIINSG